MDCPVGRHEFVGGRWSRVEKTVNPPCGNRLRQRHGGARTRSMFRRENRITDPSEELLYPMFDRCDLIADFD